MGYHYKTSLGMLLALVCSLGCDDDSQSEVDYSDVATTGAYGDLVNVPPDADTLASLGCSDGEFPMWNETQTRWICAVPVIDTKLTESKVDDFVSDNGYLTDSDLSTYGYATTSWVSGRGFLNGKAQQDSTSEGGEIKLDGAGGNKDVHIDNLDGQARIFTPGDTAKLQVIGDLNVTGAIRSNGFPLQFYTNPKLQPYDAKGDGATDDTDAIQRALDYEGNNGGGIVYLPSGTYNVEGNLVVPANVKLVGTNRVPSGPIRSISALAGTSLLATAGKGDPDGTPFILLSENSTLESINVFYPDQDETRSIPFAYPWTIRGNGGDNVSVINVTLINPYYGLDLKTNRSGRHYVRGLYGQPLNIGIWVDKCLDVGRIKEVHFWPFWSSSAPVKAYIASNAVGIRLERTDWEVIDDYFSWGYKIGLQLGDSSEGVAKTEENGPKNVVITNLQLDNVDIGIDAQNTNAYGVLISNLNIANAGGGSEHIAIRSMGGGHANLLIKNASFWGDLEQVVKWEGTGTLSLSGARIGTWRRTKPAIEILAGRAMITHSWFPDPKQETNGTETTGVAIKLGPNTDRVSILGNQLVGNTMNIDEATKVLEANNSL